MASGVGLRALEIRIGAMVKLPILLRAKDRMGLSIYQCSSWHGQNAPTAQ